MPFGSSKSAIHLLSKALSIEALSSYMSLLFSPTSSSFFKSSIPRRNSSESSKFPLRSRSKTAAALSALILPSSSAKNFPHLSAPLKAIFLFMNLFTSKSYRAFMLRYFSTVLMLQTATLTTANTSYSSPSNLLVAKIAASVVRLKIARINVRNAAAWKMCVAHSRLWFASLRSRLT